MRLDEAITFISLSLSHLLTLSLSLSLAHSLSLSPSRVLTLSIFLAKTVHSDFEILSQKLENKPKFFDQYICSERIGKFKTLWVAITLAREY
jgi:hypothetical protein